MKDSRLDPDRNSKAERAREARHIAGDYLRAADSLLNEEAYQDEASPSIELFRRDPSRAQATEDAIMGRVRALGRPDRPPAHWSRGPARVATILAAAALVAVASSLLTVWAIERSSTVSVRFVLEAPGARSVTLAADFTDWSPEGYDLKQNRETGQWEIIVSLRKGRAYSYNFIVDGERWVVDPSAPVFLDDGLGGKVSSISL
ncbi:MAG: hypothetical protein E4H20_08730 [Spirochaetales bacterium]|nr:MAG: hypothetical protein E4H20_08730 [Spirochaetales bacterium]